MPEPNLPPLKLIDQDKPSENYNILNVNHYREKLPELPYKTRSKLMDKYELIPMGEIIESDNEIIDYENIFNKLK